MKDDFIGTRYSAFWDKIVQGVLSNFFVHTPQLLKCAHTKLKLWTSVSLHNDLFYETSTSDNVSLITATECSDSKVTEKESKSFFESQAPATSTEDNKPEEIDDADDLVTILCVTIL